MKLRKRVLLLIVIMASLHEWSAAFAHEIQLRNVEVVVETRIERPDPQVGMKSRQEIRVDFGGKRVSQSFRTGSTVIFGHSMSSVRDNFTVDTEEWFHTAGHDVVKLLVKGHTASGVRVMPGIDYELTVYVANDGEIAVDGCHDGYPSYLIKVGDRVMYKHKHKRLRLYKLFGSCDTSVRMRTGENYHRWSF